MEQIDKVERLTNLVLLLLSAKRPLTLNQICDSVAGYPGDDKPEARRQAFERDKRILREEGVVISVEEPPDGGQAGYLIKDSDYYLPDLALSPSEQAAVGVAVASFHIRNFSPTQALSKLGFGGHANAAFLATLPSSPWLAAMNSAVTERRVAKFNYREESREIEPYRLLLKGGYWYVIGRDCKSASIRTFRLDRIDADVTLGPEGAFAVPQGSEEKMDLTSEPWRIGGDGETEAIVEADSHMSALLEPLMSAGGILEDANEQNGKVRVAISVSNRQAFVAWVLSLSPAVKLVGPPDLVDELVGWLEKMVGAE